MLPEWDYKALAFMLSLFNTLGLVVTVIYTSMTNRQKVNTDSIKSLDAHLRKEVNELDDRLIRVEKSVEHLPTHNDIEKLNRRIDAVAQEMRKIEGTLDQVNNNVQLIHQHLLNSKDHA